jgi:hypothetical protein
LPSLPLPAGEGREDYEQGKENQSKETKQKEKNRVK